MKKRNLLFSFLLLVFNQLNYAQLEYPGPVDITGSAEVIFSSATDSCSSENIPDAPVRFFRDANNQIQVIISHFEGYRMTGPDFNSLSVDCANGPVWNSDFDTDPSKYNNKEWLTGLYTQDGKTIYSLVHNEHEGSNISNWYNSITLAVSNDTGKTYSHTTPPNHLVASIPYTYHSGMGPAGIFEPSNIIYHDGYYYVMLHTESYGLQETGASIMRTQDISDPASWEVWDGEGFNNTFINPYTTSSSNPAEHVAAILDYGKIEKMHESISWNTYFNKFILVGSAQKNGVWGFYYSLSEDLINWTVRQKIMEVNLNIHAQSGSDVYGYPTIIDHNDTTRNFEVTGREVYLYYSKWPYGENYNRTLERIPIRFNKRLVDGFEVTGKGDNEDTNLGDGIAATKFGKASLRSAIEESNNRPTWLRDSVITISFNIEGSGVQKINLNNYLPDINYPVKIDGYTQPGSKENTNQFSEGCNAEPLIRINANGNGGLTCRANNTTIRGLVINNHVGAAISFYDVNNCIVEGNFLGTTPDGLTNGAEEGNGVSIEICKNIVIGGDEPSKRNIILGGITIMGSTSTDNVIAGNYIGTDKTGTVALSKNSPGIQIIEGANNNTIGGEYSSARNLISGNWMHGIFVSGENVEYNNIFNNFIGTDVTGKNKLPNNFEGVYFSDKARFNSIGKIDAGNIISGNGESGIRIENSSNNFIYENYIGTNPDGDQNLGNSGTGILIYGDASNNLIGSDEAESGNYIAFNSGSGIAFTGNSAQENFISRNSIYKNKLLGIDLNWDGVVNENDLNDEDEGPNGLQNFPEISSAQLGDSLVVRGVFYSKPDKAYKLQFFISDSTEENGYGEGQTFIGEVLTPLGPTGQYNFEYTFPDDGYVRKYVTITATDDSNNTSEFSNSVLIREPSAQIQLSENRIQAYVESNSGTEVEFLITNIGAEALSWSIIGNESWLSLPSNSGTITPNNSDTIKVELSAINLGEGTYYDTIRVTSNDPIDSVKFIYVEFNVTNIPASMSISTDSIWVGLNKGGVAQKKFFITNNESSKIDWSLTSENRTWMSIPITNDSLGGNQTDTVTLSFNTVGLQNGAYPNILDVYMNGGSIPEHSIKILMEVGDYPTIDVSTDTLKFMLKPGEEKTIPLKIRNTGKLDLEWSVNWTYYSKWIKPEQKNGTITPNNETNVNIRVNANDVDSSYGEGVLIVHSNDPNYDPILIPVVVKISSITGIENIEKDIPQEYALQQNYPNPFNPTTIIQYSIPQIKNSLSRGARGVLKNVTLKVYDILGKEVATLVNKEQAPGRYSVIFDVNNLPDVRHGLPSGIYIYTIQAGEFTSSKKLVLIK